MNTLLLYMVKSATYLAGFYFVYFLFLSRDTYYSRNRSFLLLSLIFSFLLPLISLSLNQEGKIAYFGKTLSEVFITAERGKGINSAAANAPTDPGTIILTVYITGIIIFGLKLLFDTGSLLVMIAMNRSRDERIIRFSSMNTPGFSAIGHVFINKALADSETDEVVRHEMNHLKHNHWIDILLIEIVKVIQWFNPVVYLMNRSLRAVHEYQADAGCLSAGITVLNYQKLLLNHIFSSRIFTASNSFSNPSLIRKRMKMMSRKKSGSFTSLKLIFAIPVTIILLLLFSSWRTTGERNDGAPQQVTDVNSNNPPIFEIQKSSAVREKTELPPPPPPPPPPSDKSVILKDDQPSEAKVTMDIVKEEVVPEEAPSEVFVVVEEMPVFPGGDKAIMDFIYKNIVYPTAAKEKNIQGRVVLRFVVTYKGTVSNVQIIKGVDPALDAEARRVIESLPEWAPGKQGGKPVNVWYSVPVTFQLK